MEKNQKNEMERESYRDDERERLIRLAVDHHLEGRVRRDIDLNAKPQDLEYLKIKASLNALHSEKKALRLFKKLTSSRTRSDQGDQIIKETLEKYPRPPKDLT